MFTGIIQATGRVRAFAVGSGAARLTVSGPEEVLSQLREGDSIAVNGVCLTAIQPEATLFHADLARETLTLTTLGELGVNAIVNLELPTRAGSPLGGHIVLGHVEGIGRIVSLDAMESGSDSSDWRLRVWAPSSLAAGLVYKGSVAIDGVSLTIAALAEAEREGLKSGLVLDVAIIPHTYQATRLYSLSPGDPVNLETDVMLRSARQNAAAAPHFEVTLEYLIANGY